VRWSIDEPSPAVNHRFAGQVSGSGGDILHIMRFESELSMKIGELAALTGLSASRIRFYESAGVLRAVQRGANGYRKYSADALLELNLVVAAQHAGFSLDELRELLPTGLKNWDHDLLVKAIGTKVQQIEKMEAQLSASKGQLMALLTDIEARPEGLDCAANARRVLSNLPLGDAPVSKRLKKDR